MLVRVELPKTKSNIVKKNGGIIYCAVYREKKGRFRKDVEESREFGRRICDAVKKRMHNKGFFTSDELPGYGISEEEKAIILERTGAGKDDLVAIFAYEKDEAEETKRVLDEILKESETHG
ncbi:MAG: hypothetical protein J7K68_04825 [Candidatus Diapherotrites archaeon]|nr:hypothetical protein [Candidatus Diapherotrites archaeon]